MSYTIIAGASTEFAVTESVISAPTDSSVGRYVGVQTGIRMPPIPPSHKFKLDRITQIIHHE